jgi:hypothetical protein
VPGGVHQPRAIADLIGTPLRVQRDRDLALLEQQAEVKATNTGSDNSDVRHCSISSTSMTW